MAHEQKPDFVFLRNGRVHLNRWGRQFSRMLAVELCASAWVMLDRPRSEVAWEYWLPTPFASFPFTSLPCVTLCHQVPNELYYCADICNNVTRMKMHNPVTFHISLTRLRLQTDLQLHLYHPRNNCTTVSWWTLTRYSLSPVRSDFSPHMRL